MSGTKEKTTGKQSTKGRAGKVPAPEVAQTDAPDLPGAERSVTLPGHYVAVGASSLNVEPGTVGVSLTPEGLAAGGGSENLITATPATDDVVVLEIRARSERGFWRCGRFWPRGRCMCLSAMIPMAITRRMRWRAMWWWSVSSATKPQSA